MRNYIHIIDEVYIDDNKRLLELLKSEYTNYVYDLIDKTESITPDYSIPPWTLYSTNQISDIQYEIEQFYEGVMNIFTPTDQIYQLTEILYNYFVNNEF